MLPLIFDSLLVRRKRIITDAGNYKLKDSTPVGIYLLKVNNRNIGLVLVSLSLTLNIFHTLF